MLSVSDVTKSFGDSLVLDKINLIVNRGDRVGLVGPNGCGKSTLLRIIVGDESPDSGSVRLTIPDSRVGYLPQALVYDPGTTVRTYLSSTEFQTEEDLAGRLAIVAEEMAATTGTRFAALEREYSEIVERLSGGDQVPAGSRGHAGACGTRIARSWPDDAGLAPKWRAKDTPGLGARLAAQSGVAFWSGWRTI